MINLYRFSFSLLLFLILCLPVAGQNRSDTLISKSFTAIPFEEFARQIEGDTDFRFFYDPASVDSLIVDITVQRKTIQYLLEQIFIKTDFHFAIDNLHNIYIVKGIEIQTQLPDSFSGLTEDTYNKFQLNYLEQDEKEKSQLLAESKQYDIGKKTTETGPGKATIVGYIKSAATGESIIGATVLITDPFTGVSTDQFGYYSLTLPKGKHELNIRSTGMKPAVRKITLYSDGKLNIELLEDVITLKEIVVESERDKNISSNQMGVVRLDFKTMKSYPQHSVKLTYLK
jgi:hypothetical protein